MPIKKEELKEEKLFKVYIYAFYLYTKTSSYKYPKSIMNAWSNSGSFALLTLTHNSPKYFEWNSALNELEVFFTLKALF